MTASRKLLLALPFLAAALIEPFWPGPLATLEARVGDHFVRMHAERHPADDAIVIVDIDEASLARMVDEAGRWPWPRSVHGDLVAAIALQRPRAIVFDIQFIDRDRYRPDADAHFNEVLRDTPDVYLPLQFLGAGADDTVPTLDRLAGALGVTLVELADRLGLERAGGDGGARLKLLLPGAIDPASWRLGAINYLEDPDGIGRGYHLYQESQGWRIVSLPARLVQELGGALPDGDRVRLQWLRGGTRAFAHVPYADVDRDAGEPGEGVFTDRIVIIGSTATGLHDLRHTPIAGLHPAVEILATAIDNLKNGRHVKPVPDAVAPLTAAVLILLVVLLTRGGSTPLRSAGIALGLSAATYGAAHLAMLGQWLLPVARPLLFTWGFVVVAALDDYLLERRRRQQTTAAFRRFLDPRVVAQLVDGGVTRQALDGQAREITVLFSDIRGFTTLSERHEPAVIVGLLNDYFSRQVEVIFRHGGTLDKFIGDAIMAFWGAPSEDPEQAVHAIEAALEMTEVLEAFKREAGEVGETFDIGIGLHTGPAIVGFIGSEQRQDYTAIGDTVNLASRIEGLTKEHGRVLVSAETRARCGDAFDFEHSGSYKVKGREAEVDLFIPSRRRSDA
ncbi:MAG: adenylate/guanylate cyclase domain-containing protein [Gammaproteobacteria bacterium]|nr:adenylate/guanylate cyclase domain-containing protein [Gammaproteobacteria bacterium]